MAHLLCMKDGKEIIKEDYGNDFEEAYRQFLSRYRLYKDTDMWMETR